MSAGTGLEAIERWPAPHRAAGWITRDGRSATAGETERPFPVASVTKLLTATAILVAVQEEVVELDAPAGPPGATVRLLLSHASGLPFEGDEPIAAPGERRIYSNTGFEVLARLVAERSSIEFPTYAAEAVLTPLGMTDTTLDGSPAAGATSTLADLLRLAGELLAPGRVLAPQILTLATSPHLPDLDGVLPGFGKQTPNPWGLGFEVKGSKAPHWTPARASPATFGHFGQSGCFLWVDPDAGVALAVVSDLAFGEWAVEGWPDLGRSALRRATGG